MKTPWIIAPRQGETLRQATPDCSNGGTKGGFAVLLRKAKTLGRLLRELGRLPHIETKLDRLLATTPATSLAAKPPVAPTPVVHLERAVGEMLPSSTNWLAIPDHELQARVVGGVWPNFLVSGQETAENLRDVLDAHGRNFIDFKSTLDFGCGCARTARFLPAYGLGGALTGVDVDDTQIDFCNRWLKSLGQFVTIPFDPPMPFADSSFDFVFSLSTFTHFREDYQHIWLRELHRVAAPGATLILTIAGKRNLQYVDEGQRETLERDGFVFVEGAARGEHSPDYYHLALHSHDYVRRVWSEYFEIIDIVPEIINQNQHAVLCRKR